PLLRRLNRTSGCRSSPAPSCALSVSFSLRYSVPHMSLPSFPTRRSSDLKRADADHQERSGTLPRLRPRRRGSREGGRDRRERERDRKSTRLNSSHVSISYAVFCLKKKRLSQHAAVVTSLGAILLPVGALG